MDKNNEIKQFIKSCRSLISNNRRSIAYNYGRMRGYIDGLYCNFLIDKNTHTFYKDILLKEEANLLNNL